MISGTGDDDDDEHVAHKLRTTMVLAPIMARHNTMHVMVEMLGG